MLYNPPKKRGGSILSTSKSAGNLVATARHALANIDKEWPGIKYCSLGFYSAWILLVMSGDAISFTPSQQGISFSNANNILYLCSGIPLTLILFGCGILGKRVEPYISRGPLVPIMAVIASICTFFVVGGFGFQLNNFWFAVTAVGTGIGTPFLCLRLGHMFSTLDSQRLLFCTFAAALFGNFLYFMCSALDARLANLLLSCFPIFAILLALLRQENYEEASDFELVPLKMLPKGFLARCVIFIVVFSVVVGIIKSGMILLTDDYKVQSQALMSVFFSFMSVVVLIAVIAVVNSIKRFDLSRVYYPLIFAMAFACIITSLFGDSMLWLQVVVMNTAYNVFVLVMWCLLANIAGRTDASPTRVFGLGRGASAFGTTLGQFITLTAMSSINLATVIPKIGLVSAVVIFATAFLILGERTVGDALEKTYRHSGAVSEANNSENSNKSWKTRCENVGKQYQLTSRELELTLLLSRGRTAKYIAEELNISYSTAKGHIKNIYAKCDVHSRDELINLIDSAAE